MFLGMIFHFHMGFSVTGWDVTFCAMVSLSMVRARGPGFTRLHRNSGHTLDSHLRSLILVNPPYWGLTNEPKFGTQTWLLPPVTNFGIALVMGHFFALHFHRILENIRASYELPITGRLQESSWFLWYHEQYQFIYQGSINIYIGGQPDNGYYNNSLSWSILIYFAVTLKSIW
jgi:hypothetical protein